MVLTLQDSKTILERTFLAMKILETRLKNKMDNEFLADTLIIYIEKYITNLLNTTSVILSKKNTTLVIDEFDSSKRRRAQLT